ncbi:MAG: enoyl-CoA hydratase/isomerase family protein [Alphaproteobacteria bacterium]
MPGTDTLTDAPLLTEIRNGTGIITLNRPKALNALNLDMIRMMADALTKWADDESITQIVVEGAGERAFCAGGDVVAVAKAATARYVGQDTAETLSIDFFAEEYALNWKIFNLGKPYIALWDGIVMGGGAGISLHGPVRIATDNTMFAMPENMIGLYPDVGICSHLMKAPGQIGTWLGMTGARLHAADLIWCGYASHYVPQADMPTLRTRLLEGEPVADVLAGLATTPPEQPTLPTMQADIDAGFAGDSVEEIISALAAAGTDWAGKQLETLSHQSPSSQRLTLGHLRSNMPMKEQLVREFRLTQHCCAGHDLREGIRAALIDKDRNPKWQPATLAEVPADLYQQYSRPAPEGELTLD